MMFDWARFLHRQVYDVLSDEMDVSGQKGRDHREVDREDGGPSVRGLAPLEDVSR
jgi:hypothetical protein